MNQQQQGSELVLFELLHLELVSQAVQGTGFDVEGLEKIGYSAGYRLVEKLARDGPKFKDELDLLKFICKDFWGAVFRKQIDNLRTNHQGVYVLQDNCFRFLGRISADRQYLEASPKVDTLKLDRGSAWLNTKVETSETTSQNLY
ncbi:trafficking protein particle complex subunit 6B [Eurytemora carolleeae]|uniref:trafficking protein particle complex subunit 6B n=1 Tax=Eurytemora carolleeae TaxID=1294199 RepID=UPI000C768D03|nr:trafficking protein particle complex subunit 6B [Eurytemora carolleeae]|eukprot:XP_023324820.1 trafficking protein particle complex subunit 6B-like [Eurytemora affinis]